MPTIIENPQGGTSYANPFVGGVDHPLHLKIDLSLLTTDEVDSKGNLKPGVAFDSTGTPVGSGQFVYGVVFEPVRLPLATIPPTNTSLGNETADCLVAVNTIGVINRDIAEDNMGRAYTADELAGFDLAGSHIRLTTT
jgi:hypothetical protein